MYLFKQNNLKEIKKIKTAIVGFGGMASGWHYYKMLKTKLYDIVGVYDIDKSRCKIAISKGLKVYDSYDELLNEKGLELVLIATPNDWHDVYAIQALNKGINVFCEKPVTLSSEQLQNMIDAQKNSGKLLMVHQNRRWDKDFLIIKSIYESCSMGAMYKVDSNVTGSHGIPGGWRKIKAQGGGMLLDWGVHLIDQMLTMNKSKVVGVTCKASYIFGHDCDDGIFMTLDFQDGFTANINIDTNKFVNTPRWYAYGLNGSAVIRNWICQGKIIKLISREDSKNKGISAGNGFTKTMADRSKSTVVIKRLPRVKTDNFAIYNNIYACLRENAEPIITMDSVMRCMKVMEAGFKSIEESKTIKVDI